ncbi:MAG: TetR/AcrR family transcriptional regulator [Gammaproteobacteria bacterium]|nr:TetR/AcrR family transcriptional regulator [Gammaproteobacteria bacterium]
MASDPQPEPRNSLSQAERTALSDRRMLEAAVELIVERGIEKATLKDIGERAGYSRGLATYRFGSKAGLFRAVIRAVAQRWLGELTRSVGQRTGIEALCTCIDSWHRFAMESPSHIRALHILFYQCIGPDTGFKERVAEVLRKQRDDVESWVRVGIARGEIDPALDPARQAELFCAFIYGSTYQWLVEPGAIDFHGIAEDFKRALRASLAAPASRKVS